MNRLNKTESAVFLYCRFSLLLRGPFFPDYLCLGVLPSVVLGTATVANIIAIKRHYMRMTK